MNRNQESKETVLHTTMHSVRVGRGQSSAIKRKRRRERRGHEPLAP